MKYLSTLLALFLFETTSAISQGNITWADDVACIIYNNCTQCHHPDGIAPVSFLTYQDVYQKRASVRIYVQDRVMPPSPAHPVDVPFRNDNILSDEEIQTIVQWVLDGAPSGDLGSAPPAPDIQSEEEITDPDAIVRIDPYTSQAVFNDDYRCFALETNFSEDKWVTGIEIVPGNRSIVHHVILFEDANDAVLNLDAADPLSGYQCFGGVGSFSANFVGGWVPGQSAQFVPDGMGLLIPQGTNLIIQTHYPEGTAGMVDSTKINLRFAPNGNGLRRVRVAPLINHFTSLTNGPLIIPANTVRTFHAEATVAANASIIGVLPHMHLIGRSMSAYAVTPANDTIRLFDIPDWNFDWQLNYSFRSPIHLPFGSKVYADATYDNTVNNPYNPSFPPVDVMAGEATTDEMFLIFFSYLIYQSGDENMVFQDAPPLSDACSETSAVVASHPTSLRIAPNPADDKITIVAPWNTYEVRLYNMYGQLQIGGASLRELQTGAMAEGMYVLMVKNGKEELIEKIIITH